MTFDIKWWFQDSPSHPAQIKGGGWGGCMVSSTQFSQTCLKGVTKGKDKKWLLKTSDPLIQVHLHYMLVQGI